MRGEITLLIQPFPPSDAASATAAPLKIAARIAQIQAESNVDEKEALKRLARELGQSKSELYRELQRERSRIATGSRGIRKAQ
jgi:16S rRNA (cytidine1402-2'-O)-methyltransferase